MSRDSLNINVFGEETYFNDDVTFFKNVNIRGNLEVDGTDNYVDSVSGVTTYTLPITGTSSTVTATLTGSDSSTDPVTITAGTGITFSSISAGGFTINSTGIGSGGSSDPVGTIVGWASSTAPTGWLECNGQSTSGYTELAALIGSNVPDLRGEFVRGWDNSAGIDTGRTLGSTQSDEFKEHNHTIVSFGRVNVNPNGVQNPFYSRSGEEDTSSVGGTETRPRNVALMYIIKHTATSGGGGTGTLTDVDVKQYSDSNTPRTEYGCSNPIEVTVTAGIATIGIGSTSNAYGKKYIQTTEPTTDVCDGDIWYDTTAGSGSSGGFVTGMIMMFSGTTAPTGWVLCNNSTEAQAANAPDLRDRFIVGTGSSYSLNATGGSANAVLIAHSHVHNNDIVEEGNEFSIGPGSRSASSLNDSTEITGINAAGSSNTSQTGTNANLPPYYALAFIMKT